VLLGLGAYFRSFFAAALVKVPVKVSLTRFRPTAMGMTKKKETCRLGRWLHVPPYWPAGSSYTASFWLFRHRRSGSFEYEAQMNLPEFGPHPRIIRLVDI
jgi:hypothetical protein